MPTVRVETNLALEAFPADFMSLFVIFLVSIFNETPFRPKFFILLHMYNA
jgi:hypothetical protein